MVDDNIRNSNISRKSKLLFPLLKPRTMLFSYHRCLLQNRAAQILLVLLTLGLLHKTYGQQVSGKDFDHAAHFIRDSLYEHTYHREISPKWLTDSSGFAYKNHTRDGDRYCRVSFEDNRKRPAFSESRLAGSLKQITGETIDSDSLPLNHLEWINADSITFSVNNKFYKANLNSYTIERHKEADQQADMDKEISPDGNYYVSIKDHNLYLKDCSDEEETALTTDGAKNYVYGSEYGWAQTMKGENATPDPKLKAQWSPDSKKIATQVMDSRNAEKMFLLNWSIDSLYRPQLISYFRGSPGDTAIVKYKPVIFDRKSHKMTKIDLPPIPHFIDDMPHGNLKWTEDGEHLYGIYYHRGFKKLDIIEIDPKTGKSRTVFTDSSATHIKYNLQFRYLEKQNTAFITSERSGWNQLYRVNWKTGETTPLTNGNYVVQEIKAVDTTKQELYFTASGKEEGTNPYYQFLYKVDFDGKHLNLLTPKPFNHNVAISPDYRYFIDNASTPQKTTISALKRTKDGQTLKKIDSTDIGDLTDKGWSPPEIFTTTGKDGETTIYGSIWKPIDFDPDKAYPIIDYTYTGPHTQIVPHDFPGVIWPYAYRDNQALAELGFIVIQVDGLGSIGRSKAFQDVSYKNMGDNLKDHTRAIKYLGEEHKYIDTTRVGIYGHSAGGYDAAHALLAFNDTYDVAISESGDQDWRMEKAWWPEMYAGWPVGDYYDEQSNVTLAPHLDGKLLLIHGGIDENVNPSATFKLGEALIKADKYFDMLIIPSGHHHFPEDYVPYVTKKRWHYFVENLIVRPSK